MSEEREIHPSHVPEPDGERFWHGGKSCRKCLCLIEWDYSLAVLGPVTIYGAEPCVPLMVDQQSFPVLKETQGHIHWVMW